MKISYMICSKVSSFKPNKISKIDYFTNDKSIKYMRCVSPIVPNDQVRFLGDVFGVQCVSGPGLYLGFITSIHPK